VLAEGTTVTCPTLLRPSAAAEVFGDLRSGLSGAAHRGAERVRRDDGTGQFARFVLVGGLSSAVYALLFAVLTDPVGSVAANVLGSVASSVLANELHRRLTFHAGERIDWLTAQWEGGALAAAGIVATSAALAWLTSVVGSPGVVVQLLLVGAVTGAIGMLRFVALRWAFGARAVEPA
jgi:putative flippase GtrA